MLKVLLQLIADNDRLLSLSDLAKQLGTSEGLLRQMIDDLVRLGYLVRLREQACGGCGQGAGCHGCSSISAFAGWSLTEKGRLLTVPSASRR